MGFPIEAAAEPVRLTMSMCGIDFTDVRVPFDEWPALKPSMKYGQMPCLEVDGKKMYQSDALMKFIATKYGGGKLYPPELLYEVEEALGLCVDLSTAMNPSVYVGMRPADLGHEGLEGDAKSEK